MVKKIYTPLPSGVVQRKIVRALCTDFFYTTPAFSDTTFLKSCIIPCPEVEGTRKKLGGYLKKNLLASLAKIPCSSPPPLSNCVLHLCLTLRLYATVMKIFLTAAI